MNHLSTLPSQANRCPICHCRGEALPLCDTNGYHIVSCPECRGDYVVAPPSFDELADYYDRPEWFEGGEVGGYANYDSQTESSLKEFEATLDRFPNFSGLSILDIGCGYGNHLAVAASRGWKCFGVEPSAHARNVASERLGKHAMIVSRSTDLIPHAFDLVLMFDVIEHVADPYRLFYELFSIGAITPQTRLILTTPNAASHEARTSPAAWRYRHPPSHLVYYSATALRTVLERLHFNEITISGMHASVEDAPIDDEWQNFAGLRCEATGSDFTHFMRERYVPGTWAKIAEYEHLPRYRFACGLANDLRILDFGCGTGYGAALMAQSGARLVLGLDIDPAALDWARQTHRFDNLRFERHTDFGATLPAASFDLITCFEMIEHVGYQNQLATIASLSRLLAPGGRLLISTPNPEVTKRYGENPYHLREMTRDEFIELLQHHFRHIRIFDQHVFAASALTDLLGNPASYLLASSIDPGLEAMPALAYVALCTHTQLEAPPQLIYADVEGDYIATELHLQRLLNEWRMIAHRNNEEASSLEAQMTTTRLALAESNAKNSVLSEQLAGYLAEIEKLRAQIEILRAQIVQQTDTLRLIQQSHWHRLGISLKRLPGSPRALAEIIWQIGAMATPRKLRPALSRLARRLAKSGAGAETPRFKPYSVNAPQTTGTERTRTLHVIANLKTGGSSRLVVDLIEHLGDRYEQSVLTSHVPSPPHYVGIDIHEIPLGAPPRQLQTLLRDFAPDFLHIHYWGDCDEAWYRQIFEAAEQLRLPVIQNVNTPIRPFASSAIVRNVYVSNYVRSVFAPTDPLSTVVYPGSDFSLFSRRDGDLPPDDCIGMVYRLENDKLNEHAIDVFIETVRQRPATRCLIVGGGNLLATYRQAVLAAGIESAFEFTDFVAYQELPELYRRLSVFVAPVWKESFGQVSPFAMSMGIPVAGYHVGALAEITDDPALLAPAGDSHALAGILCKLLDDRTRRLEIGARNRARAHRLFSVESMIAAYADIYAAMPREMIP